MFTKVQSRSLALAAVSLAVGLVSHQALAANSVSGTSKAVILSAINLTEGPNLNFGSILPGATTGTVAVSVTGAATATTATYITGATAGGWTATGTSGAPFVLTLDASDLLLGPGPSMTIDTFTNDAPSTFTSGSVTFHVGATLHVGSAVNQTPGPYSGTYQVTVNY
jgi:hypothetical protein